MEEEKQLTQVLLDYKQKYMEFESAIKKSKDNFKKFNQEIKVKDNLLKEKEKIKKQKQKDYGGTLVELEKKSKKIQEEIEKEKTSLVQERDAEKEACSVLQQEIKKAQEKLKEKSQE